MSLVKASIAGPAVNLGAAKLLDLARAGKVPCVRLNARVIRFDVEEVVTALRQLDKPRGGALAVQTN